MSKYEVVKTFMFDGLVKDSDGKVHHVRQTWCDNCGKLSGETHQDCCGYASNGWIAKEPCECRPPSPINPHIVYGK